jgi:alpha-tubulin suppressor-like RCC1 family protein
MQSTPPDGLFIDVAAGDRHTCARNPTGQIVCWGRNDRGQTNAPSGQFVALAAGGNHSCGLSVTGNTVCWGESADGRLAAPPPPTFKELALGGDSLALYPILSGYGSIVCGIRSDDTRFCSNVSITHATMPEPDLHGFAIGDQNIICALRRDKTPVCWGDAFDRAIFFTPSEPLDVISVGSLHACGVRPNRTVACWGSNGYGQTNVPAEIAGP